MTAVRDWQWHITAAAESSAHLKRIEQALQDELDRIIERLSERFASYERPWQISATALLRIESTETR